MTRISYTFKNARKGNTDLSALNVPLGALLRLERNPRITAFVVDPRAVLYEGEVQSLSCAAKAALASEGLTETERRGPSCWTYNGETLTEIHARLNDRSKA